MSTRGRLTIKGRLLTGWWGGFVLTVFLASAPLLADQDKDLLDLESGALALSATTQFGGRWNVRRHRLLGLIVRWQLPKRSMVQKKAGERHLVWQTRG